MKIKLICFGIIGIAIISVYFYISHLKSELENVKNLNSVLTLQVQEQNKTIDKMKTDFSEIQTINKNLKSNNDSNQIKIQQLEQSLDKKESQLKELAQKKPEAVQKIVNTASFKVLKCFEDLSRNIDNGNCVLNEN